MQKGFRRESSTSGGGGAAATTGGPAGGGGGGTAAARAVVRSLVRKGVKLLALDFDQTIVGVHTAGAWKGPSSRLAQHVRPCFRDLIEAAVAEPALSVCVVTFSAQRGVIEDVLKCVLPHWCVEYADMCPKRNIIYDYIF